jgi:hypothetical protein
MADACHIVPASKFVIRSAMGAAGSAWNGKRQVSKVVMGRIKDY